MKRVILFEDLDKINFYFSILLIPFFKKIYFREASYARANNFFIRKKNKIFFQIGIKNQSGKLVKKSYAVKKYILKNLIHNNFKEKFFDKFCKLINLDIKNKKSLIFTLENKIYISRLESIETSSYICIKKIFANCQTYYVPSSDRSYIIMKQIKNNNLKIISSLLFINIFYLNIVSLFKFISNKKIILFKEIKKKNIDNKNNKKYRIGYCPHQGLKYGNFFKKTFFYGSSKNSPLYKHNIETISFNYFDKVSARYLKFFKLRNTELNKLPFQISIKQIFLFILFFFKNKKFILKHHLIFFKIFFELYLSINRYNNFFKEKKYNFLFFDNDTLIPAGFQVAAKINRIFTLSMQDRLISYMYFNRCFFDQYFIAGSKFEKIFKYKYFINNYEVLGLTRAKLIKKKKLYKTDYLYNFKSDIVACLPVTINSDWDTNLYGEVGTSINSNLTFCKNIVKLSKFYKEKQFIIKFKFLDHVRHKIIIKKINNIVSSSNNVYLNFEKNLSSANLIAHSELVIGIYSTILDEALAVGKNVLIYDNDKFISSFSFFRKNKFFLVNNFNELFFKFKSIINKDKIFYKNYIKNKKNYVNNYLTENAKPACQNKIFEKVEKYIKRQTHKSTAN